MTTATNHLTELMCDACPDEPAGATCLRRIHPAGCRSWLAVTLAAMCLAQTVLTTGVWLRPYAWWQSHKIAVSYPWPNDIKAIIEEGDIAFYGNGATDSVLGQPFAAAPNAD